MKRVSLLNFSHCRPNVCCGFIRHVVGCLVSPTWTKSIPGGCYTCMWPCWIITDYHKIKHFCWWNAFDMCRMGWWSFWSWFDANQFTFDVRIRCRVTISSVQCIASKPSRSLAVILWLIVTNWSMCVCCIVPLSSSVMLLRRRLFIWRTILQLPENHAAYAALVEKGIHPTYATLQKKYPIKSHKLQRVLQRSVSLVTAHCCCYCCVF